MRYALTDVIEEIVGKPIPERGENAMVRCPLHEDRRPSLSVNLESGVWVCFSCGERGKTGKLARVFNTIVDGAEVALRSVRGIDQPVWEEETDFADLARALHERAKADQPKSIVSYINAKGLVGEVFTHFRLGWDGDRIAMPYWDGEKCLGIKYRNLFGQKSSEKGSRRVIYNSDDIAGKAQVIVCEGESDTHAVWSQLRRDGLTDTIAAVGIPGAMVSRSQWELWALDLMWANRVHIAWDADDAGDRGSAQAIEVLGDKALRMRPTKGKDMAEHLLAGGSIDGI